MSNSLGNVATKQTKNHSLPNDWSVVKLGEVLYEGTERNRGLNYTRADVLGVDNQNGLIPSERLLGEDFSRYKLVEKNQFAYNPMRLNVGSIGLWANDQRKIVSPDYVVFGCKGNQIDPDYLDLFRQSAAWKQHIQQSGQGSVRIRYYYRHISEFLIPLPPLAEQKAIAHVLRTVQQAKEATEKVIAATRQLKQSLMKHLFTYGPVPFDQADKVELKETEIGEIAKNWDVVTIGEIVTRTQYGISKRGEKNGRYPILRMSNLVDGQVATDDLQFVNLDDEEFASFRVNNGDLLFNRTNSHELVGKTSLFGLTTDYVFASYLIRVTPNQDLVDRKYLNYYLNLGFTQARLKQLATRAVSQSNINATKLRNFNVPLPPLDVQQNISENLSRVDQKMTAEVARQRSLNTVFNSLLYHLMTGKIRVPIELTGQ